MRRAYTDMREANWKNSDKYFHARGNYDAARRGPGGRWAAKVIRWGHKLLVALTTTWLADCCTSLHSRDADWMKFTSCCLIFSFSVVAESWRTDWGVAVQPTLLLIRKQTAGAEMEATPTVTGQGGFLQNTSLKPSSDHIIKASTWETLTELTVRLSFVARVIMFFSCVSFALYLAWFYNV